MPELADFKGRWRLTRRIDDRRAGHRAHFEGIATFHEDGPGLRLREEGVLRLPGQSPIAATRSYLWRTEGDWIDVRFDDGQPFHRFDPCAPRPTARHPCGEDLYHVRYDFRGWPIWDAVWHVAGPRKDYDLQSRLVPCKAGGTEAEIAAGELAE